MSPKHEALVTASRKLLEHFAVAIGDSRLNPEEQELFFGLERALVPFSKKSRGKNRGEVA